MEETIYFISDMYRCWNKRVPGMTKINSYLGTLIITRKRFLFLSSASNQILRKLPSEVLVKPFSGNLEIGKSSIKILDLSALKNQGSIELTLEQLKNHAGKRRWDFGAYLTIVNHRNEEISFMKDPYGMDMKEVKKLDELLTNLKRGIT